jgi:hypothetical protein
MKVLLVTGAFVCILIGLVMCFLFATGLLDLLNANPSTDVIHVIWLGFFAAGGFAPAFMLCRKKGEPMFIGLVEIIIICVFGYGLLNPHL